MHKTNINTNTNTHTHTNTHTRTHTHTHFTHLTQVEVGAVGAHVPRGETATLDHLSCYNHYYSQTDN